MFRSVDEVLELLERAGGAAYLGESVTQLEHALQAAAAALEAKAAPPLVAAALLHDIGHLLPAPQHLGDDAAHEETGARWLSGLFPPAVTEPIRLHVPAKRYLCFAEPGYLKSLSAASQASLRVQGGPFTAEDAGRFVAGQHARDAVALRHWDEAAKVPGGVTPGLAEFRPIVEQAATGKGEAGWGG
jgi:gamma-butyrobetaine dioxygenase